VGEKLAGLGDFLVPSGRFLVVQKFIDLTLVQIFEFWRHKFEFGRYIFEFWRQIFEFWCQNQIIGSFQRVWGGWVGPPGPRGFVINVGKKSCAYQMIHSFPNMHSSYSLPFHISIDSGHMSRANPFTRRYSLPFRT